MTTQLLCPADIVERYRCSVRKAFRMLRAAGAFEFGESLRIEPEKFAEWERKRIGTDSTEGQEVDSGTQATPPPAAMSRPAAVTSRRQNSGARPVSALPPIRHTQPRKLRRSGTSAE